MTRVGTFGERICAAGEQLGRLHAGFVHVERFMAGRAGLTYGNKQAQTNHENLATCISKVKVAAAIRDEELALGRGPCGL